MKQDDYLLNQIDLMGKVLAKIIALILKKRNDLEIFELSEFSIPIGEKQLPVYIEKLLKSSDNELIELLEKNNVPITNFEKLGDLFYLISNKLNQRLNCLQKSKLLFSYVHTHSKTYSIERVHRIRKIEEEITKNDLP